MLKSTLLSLILFVPAAQAEVRSGPQKVHLLELFSTQSCHSCPPAQKWVSALGTHAQVFKTFVPVVYHVDYWDYLGWKDPFSSPAYTQLQRRYQAQGSSRAMYTPMFARDGKEWRRRTIAELAQPGENVGVITLRHLGKFRYQVRFRPLDSTPATSRVFAALQGSGIVTKVQAGENQGKSLEQDFITLQYKQAALRKEKGGELVSEIEFSPTQENYKLSVVFWVSPKDRVEPVQTIGARISKEGRL